MTVVAQSQAGPAAGSGAAIFKAGRPPEDCATSYYATSASMIAGHYHVLSGYARAAKEAGRDDLYRRAIALSVSDPDIRGQRKG